MKEKVVDHFTLHVGRESSAGGLTRTLRTLLFAGLGCGLGATPLAAQEPFLFSLSGTGQTATETLEDQEIAYFDAAQGMVFPWLRTATGAFFSGDLNGDGLSEEWSDVDALHHDVAVSGATYFSLLSNLSGFLDGDILRWTPAGDLQVVILEADVVTAFGISDGNLDVDAYHQAPDGTRWLSFAENENSTLLSGDAPGVIQDGAILRWDPATSSVSVVYTESQVDALVSQALGASRTTTDTLGVSLTSSGDLAFCVQSPSASDASVFSDALGGTELTSELSLGFLTTVEMNALSFTAAPLTPFAADAQPRQVAAGASFQILLSSARPLQGYVVLLSWAKGDAALYPGQGFEGLYLQPLDPLFSLALSSVWLYGVTDGQGQATVTFPSLPGGLRGILYAQIFDLTDWSYGTPVAIDLQG